MIKRLICVLLTMGALLGVGLGAAAAEETGSIRVTLQNGETVVPDGAVTLYHAGEPSDGGFCLTDAFGGGLVRKEDALSPALAQWLTEMAGGDGISHLLDADGSSEFTGLPAGLYLLVQSEESSGYHLMQPIMITMPYDHQWKIQAYPKTEEIILESPPTGQHPAPIVAAMVFVLSGIALIICTDIKRHK